MAMHVFISFLLLFPALQFNKNTSFYEVFSKAFSLSPCAKGGGAATQWRNKENKTFYTSHHLWQGLNEAVTQHNSDWHLNDRSHHFNRLMKPEMPSVPPQANVSKTNTMFIVSVDIFCLCLLRIFTAHPWLPRFHGIKQSFPEHSHNESSFMLWKILDSRGLFLFLLHPLFLVHVQYEQNFNDRNIISIQFYPSVYWIHYSFMLSLALNQFLCTFQILKSTWGLS